MRTVADPTTALLERGLAARRSAARRLYDANAGRIAELCHAVAERCARGGRLLACAGSPAGASDARHLAVEFVHPVIVGKRALPAIALTTDVATLTGIAEAEGIDQVFAHQLRYLSDPADIALGISADGDNGSVLAGLATAHALGLLTIALTGGDGGRIAAAHTADHLLTVASDDPCVVKEMQVTTYHILWELVHVLFEQPGVLGPGVVQ